MWGFGLCVVRFDDSEDYIEMIKSFVLEVYCCFVFDYLDCFLLGIDRK